MLSFLVVLFIVSTNSLLRLQTVEILAPSHGYSSLQMIYFAPYMCTMGIK